MKVYRAKIEDSDAFNGDKGKYHRYVVCEDESSDDVKIIQIGHLFIPDKKRFDKIHKKFGFRYRFEDEDVPVYISNEIQSISKDTLGEKNVLSQKDEQFMLKKFK